MGHALFIILHIVAVLFGFVFLVITIPTHLIYAVLAGIRKSAEVAVPTEHTPPPPPHAIPLEVPAAVAGEDVDVYDIVGESHYQRELEQLFGSRSVDGIDKFCEARLVPEPTNRYDKNAVRCDIGGRTVGYLARDDAKEFARYMRRKKISSLSVTANVRGGWKRAAGEGKYGVCIEVPAGTVSDA